MDIFKEFKEGNIVVHTPTEETSNKFIAWYKKENSVPWLIATCCGHPVWFYCGEPSTAKPIVYVTNECFEGELDVSASDFVANIGTECNFISFTSVGNGVIK